MSVIYNKIQTSSSASTGDFYYNTNHNMGTNATTTMITTNPVHSSKIIIHNDGDIYQGDQLQNAGVFKRLERIEEMMGILKRNHALEDIYTPLAQAGELYDEILEEAISKIMEITTTTMKKYAVSYDELTEQAKFYKKLTEEDQQ